MLFISACECLYFIPRAPFLMFTLPVLQSYVKSLSSDNVIVLTSLDNLVLGLTLQILVWVVKSHVQNSIAAAFIGFFYGPIFPAALAMANDILPNELHMVVMALM